MDGWMKCRFPKGFILAAYDPVGNRVLLSL